jgi:hypothetical protein
MRALLLLSLLTLLLPQAVHAQGLNWNPEAFAKREQIQPTRDILPTSASLKRYAPFVHNQYGSTCVAFSLASARTILHAKRNAWTDKDVISANSFSPWFIYYRNREPADNTASMGLDPDKALTDLLNNGVQRLLKVEYGEYYPFSERMLTSYYPPAYTEDVQEAKNYTLEAVFRLESMDEIRFALANGMPVMIGMMPSASFERATGAAVWSPGPSEQPDPARAHAMVVVGYDDQMYGGAIEVLNSWGAAWGSGGYIWIRYADVLRFTAGAYALSDTAAKRFKAEAPQGQAVQESIVADSTGWRVMTEFNFKCGTPETTISQFSGLDPALLVK